MYRGSRCIARQTRLLSTCLVGLLLAGLAFGSIANAAHKKASIKISVPKSVRSSTPYVIKASGFSGVYEGVAIFNAAGSQSCAKTQGLEQLVVGSGAPSGVASQKVRKHHKFVFKVSYPAGSQTGAHHACVWLYQTFGTKTLRKIKAFTVAS